MHGVKNEAGLELNVDSGSLGVGIPIDSNSNEVVMVWIYPETIVIDNCRNKDHTDLTTIYPAPLNDLHETWVVHTESVWGLSGRPGAARTRVLRDWQLYKKYYMEENEEMNPFGFYLSINDRVRKFIIDGISYEDNEDE